MSTYTQILYQIVYSTKHRGATLCKENRPRLFSHMWQLLENKRCHPYQINGIEDHLHIVTHLHPSVALANVVKDLKLASSDLIKGEKLFPFFGGWQEGYSAFTYSNSARNNLIEYVKNQEEHHKVITFKQELITSLKEHGVKYNPKYLD